MTLKLQHLPVYAAYYFPCILETICSGFCPSKVKILSNIKAKDYERFQPNEILCKKAMRH